MTEKRSVHCTLDIQYDIRLEVKSAGSKIFLSKNDAWDQSKQCLTPIFHQKKTKIDIYELL